MGIHCKESQETPPPYCWKFSTNIRRLTFEELTTVLSEVEACLNSRPLGVIPHCNNEGLEELTPGHFLIGRPVEAIPDHDHSHQPISILRHWHLCEALV